MGKIQEVSEVEKRSVIDEVIALRGQTKKFGRELDFSTFDELRKYIDPEVVKKVDKGEALE